MIKSFKDATHYKDEYDPNEICLNVDVYYDDFDTKTGYSSGDLTKITAVYLTIANIPYKNSSKRSQILVSTLCSKKNLKIIKVNNLFKPLISSLHELNNNPIKIGEFHFKFKVKAVPADNLASNTAAKVCANFTLDGCIDCDVLFKNLVAFHTDKLSDEELPQPRQLNENHVFKDAPYDSPKLFPNDTTHDLDEGIIQETVNLNLSKLSQKRRDQIANVCKNELKHLFKNGLVYGIEESKIKGTAVQKYDFFILFPVLLSSINKCTCKNKKSICKCDPFKKEQFKILIQLRQLVDFCNSTFYEKEDLQTFNRMVKNFLFNLAEVTNHVTFKPHYLSHYVENIEIFGPLFFLRTLRYERQHQLLKKMVKNSNAFQSYPLQMAGQWLLYFLKNGFVDEDKERVYEIYNGAEIEKFVDSDYHPFIDKNVDLLVLKWVLTDYVRIEEKMVFLYSYSEKNNLPMFILISKIFKQNNQVKIIGKKLLSKRFINDLYSFEVDLDEELIEIDLVGLHHHLNLLFVNFKNLSLIVKNFYIPFRFSKIYEF